MAIFEKEFRELKALHFAPLDPRYPKFPGYCNDAGGVTPNLV
jgi:hypothetical protein